MLCPDLASRLPGGLVAATPAEPPPEVPGWMLPFVIVMAVSGWYLHWRWRAGRHFMSRFSTREREAAKFAQVGYVFLPAAIALTAVAAMLMLWTVFGPVSNVWFAYLFFALAAVFLVASGWTFKERWWPSDRRTPEWTRRL